ncbi:MAG: hypothetical protein Q8910_00100 [Bacteroidota bacterium]|nr:hypothetical protein [Bacteroidota bacterium]
MIVMSYCRTGDDSDVYMHQHFNGMIECAGCKIYGFSYKDTEFDTPQEALNHLIEHQKVGHKVPLYAIKRLEREIKEDTHG